MFSFTTTIVLCAFVMTITGVHMASLVKPPSKEQLSKTKLVARVDGKSYYAENTKPRSWKQSAEYCSSLNMKHATIDTPAQFAALRRAYSTDFALGYWTSGRDAMQLRQFTWNESGAQVSSELEFRPELSNFSFQTCLVFHSGRTSYLYPALCGYKSGTLCQL